MLVARTNSALEVIKTGFEQYVADAARDYGLFYGLTTAMMALLIGWFASLVFAAINERDRPAWRTPGCSRHKRDPNPVH